MLIDLLPYLFLLIAILYSMVGFGGGSSYIALLVLAGYSVNDVRMTALVCNIIVVAGATYHFRKNGLIPFKKIGYLLALSVPFAFLGGMMQLSDNIYKTIAGCALIVAALLMFYKKTEASQQTSLSPSILGGIGGGIGFLSGVIGIGGGIFLSPVLHLIKWEKAKVISAVASVFILVNSMAGIAGQMTRSPVIDVRNMLILGACVFVGGQIGNRIHIKFLNQKNVRILTACLVLFVGVRILFLQIVH